MRVIVLIGMPGSGKEEFVKVAVKRGFSVLRMGDVVRDEAEKKNVPATEVGNFANAERQRYGMGVWATRCIPFVKGNHIVIDGCRGDEEVNVFRQSFGSSLILVSIFSSLDTRYERLRKRGRPDVPKNLEEMVERDKREIGWGIGNAFVMADHMIINEGSLEEFKRKIERLIHRLRKEKD